MQYRVFLKSSPFRAVFLFALLAVTACGKTDMSLMHKINTFRPTFRDLGAEFSRVEGNLLFAQDRYPKDWAQVEPLLEMVPDTSRKGDYFRMLKEYKAILPECDSLHSFFTQLKKQFEGQVSSFSNWENEVRAGNATREEVNDRIQRYTLTCDSLRGELTSLETKAKHTIETHNTVLRHLNELMGRFENMDIEWK